MERRRVYNSNFYTQRQLCKCIQLLLISHFRAHWVSECYRLVGRASSWTHYCVCLCFTSSSFNILRLLLVADFFSIIFARVQNCIVWCFIFQFIASHFNNLFHRHNNSGYASLCTHSWECECVFDAFNSLFVVGVIQTILLMLHRAHRIWLPCLFFPYRYKRRMSKTHSHIVLFAPLSLKCTNKRNPNSTLTKSWRKTYFSLRLRFDWALWRLLFIVNHKYIKISKSFFIECIKWWRWSKTHGLLTLTH